MQSTGEAVVRIPLDGGYGWVVTFSAFMVGVILDGISFSFGLFYNEFLEYFQESKAKTAWIGSVYNGMYMFIGPFVSFLCDRFGCRKVSMFGGLLACGACVCAVVANSVSLLILTYGFLGGFGFGMMYLPALVMVGQYFDKRRALATGIAVCGSGVGAFVFAYLAEFLIDTFTWRGATLIVAGIALNGVVFGALLRPLEATIIVNPDPDDTADTADLVELQPTADAEANTRSNSDAFYLSLPDWRISSTSTSAKHQHRFRLPTVHGAGGGDTTGSQPMLLLNLHTQPQKQPPATKNQQQKQQQADAASLTGLAQSSASNVQQHRQRRLHRIDISRPKFRSVGGSDWQLAAAAASTTNLDVLRDEILRLEASQEMPQASTADDENDSLKARLRRLSREALKLLRLLRGNPALAIYGAACFLCMAGFYIPFTYIPVYAKSLSLRDSAPQDLISVTGWVNLVSRLLVGWVADRPWADSLLINSFSLTIGGIATGFFVLYRSFALLVMACVVFGSCIAIFVALRSIIGIELVGIDNLSEAFGFIILCQGLSAFIGTPLAGFLADITGSVVSTFYFAGAVILLAGLLCLPLRKMVTLKKKSNKAKADENDYSD
ncbi:hypothetical protein BOX15_Mlig013653g1 [Macrostomum lignano]|uniref:Major facilitator superfamily (MFS) profile domain-containing protein n=1 Tax=Macrostomum lignano TaxID=282301 RepID=A0A267F1B4_9PLAT|nr:hypothetical protein BOX15_Mlig013653g1 [Macrostomum lignano]